MGLRRCSSTQSWRPMSPPYASGNHSASRFSPPCRTRSDILTVDWSAFTSCTGSCDNQGSDRLRLGQTHSRGPHSLGFPQSHEVARVRFVRPKDPTLVLVAGSAVRSGLQNGSAHMKEYESRSVMRRLPVDHIEEVEEESHVGHLARSLGLWQLTAIGVGGIIGVGIFSLAGLVAHGDEDNPGVGPAVLIAFLIAGLASAAAALSYAEFAGMIPRAGSAYTYGYVALGELVGWFIGWDLLLEYIAIVAVVAIGISGYLEAFLNGFGVELPLAITASAEDGGLVNLPALLICLLVTFILGRGSKTFGRFEFVVVGIKVILILFIIGLGVFYINTANYDPFMPSGFGPVLTGAATVFFAVFGYDALRTAAEEATDGLKHMPKAIILSLIIAMTLYVAATSSSQACRTTPR